ncbi:MAG: hypothetical protein ABJH98_04410 [Reichenbachiella sp.]|uniref:hypothetical protein n=1 Tax=Reichenbachiella sp. TaxID=2184521 RepID=UPI0032995338
MTRQEALEFYKLRKGKFFNTRSIQWKMNIAIWTLFVFATYHKSKLALSNDCAVLISSVIIIGVYMWFIISIQVSLDYDKRQNDQIISQLNDSNNDDIKIELDSKKTNSGYHWIAIQLMITLVLGSFFWFTNN